MAPPGSGAKPRQKIARFYTKGAKSPPGLSRKTAQRASETRSARKTSRQPVRTRRRSRSIVRAVNSSG